MRKKIAIRTLLGYFNYGNRLQLYALSKVLNDIGSFSLRIYTNDSLLKLARDFLRYYVIRSDSRRKEIELYKFTKRHIPRMTISKKENITIFGSDQIWNPKYLIKRGYLLGNDMHHIKVSYAASLGVAKINAGQEEMFREALKEFSAISVREKTAKELLQPLTDKKIEVVLDPTLLLDMSEYAEMESRPINLSNDKYVLCYILGNRDYERAIRDFARKKNYKVILFSDQKDSKYSVEEFLYLIHHAELICTDSFHACVFSLIFERPFVAFKRTGEANYMYTRLQNLIDTFKLKNREFNEKGITKDNLQIDYAEAKIVLKKEREKSLNFLKKALDIRDEK